MEQRRIALTQRRDSQHPGSHQGTPTDAAPNTPQASVPSHYRQEPSPPRNIAVQHRPDPKSVIITLMSYSKTDGRVFSGSANDDWVLFKRKFIDLCNILGLTPDHRVLYLRYGLTRQAEHFFYEHINDKVTNWGAVITLFEKKFNSSVKQDQMLQKLRKLRFIDFKKGGKREGETLRLLTNEIERLSSMIPPSSRTDQSLRLFLKDAVLGQEWARHVAMNIDPQQLSYKQYADLLEASVSENDLHAGVDDPSTSLRQTRFTTDRNNVNFAGQRRYGMDPKVVNRRLRSWFGDQRSTGCYNCGKLHRWYDCSEKLDYERIVRALLDCRSATRKRTPTRVRKALYGLAGIMTSAVGNFESDSNSESDSDTSSNSTTSLEEESKPSPADVTYGNLLEIADTHAGTAKPPPDEDLVF